MKTIGFRATQHFQTHPCVFIHVFRMNSSELSSEGQCMLVDKLDLLEPQWPGLDNLEEEFLCVVKNGMETHGKMVV